MLQLAEQEQDKSCDCHLCGKHFGTRGAYENHLQSKRHREAVAHEQKLLPAEVARKNERNEQLRAEVANAKVPTMVEKNNESKKAQMSHKNMEAEIGRAGVASTSLSGDAG